MDRGDQTTERLPYYDTVGAIFNCECAKCTTHNVVMVQMEMDEMETIALQRGQMAQQYASICYLYAMPLFAV